MRFIESVLESSVSDIVHIRGAALHDNASSAIVLDDELHANTLLAVLLRDGVDGSELRDELVTGLWAGHDTTTSLVTFALYELTQHDEWRARVRSELDEAVAAAGVASPLELDFDAFARLVTVKAVLQETLRRHPPVPVRQRALYKPDTLGKVRLCPAQRGLLMTVAPYAVHHSVHNWREPQRFDPARFLDKDVGDKALPQYYSSNAHAFIPFGAGPRSCVGQPLAMLEATVRPRRFVSFHTLTRKQLGGCGDACTSL